MANYEYTTHKHAASMIGKKAVLTRDFKHYTGDVAKKGSVVTIDSFDSHPNTRGFGFTVDGVRRHECGFSGFDFDAAK